MLCFWAPAVLHNQGNKPMFTYCIICRPNWWISNISPSHTVGPINHHFQLASIQSLGLPEECKKKAEYAIRIAAEDYSSDTSDTDSGESSSDSDEEYVYNLRAFQNVEPF